MERIICMLGGYLIGSLSPAAFLSKIKNKDLRECGTGNLGGTNALITFGKAAGALVMIFDIAKAFFAYKLAEYLFPKIALAGMLTGASCVAGHIYPFYLKFKGGKGVAALGGMVLAYDPMMFLLLLVLCIAMMFITNHSVALPVTAAVLFPILCGITSKSIGNVLIAAAVGILIIYKHRKIIGNVLRGDDMRLTNFLRSRMSK